MGQSQEDHIVKWEMWGAKAEAHIEELKARIVARDKEIARLQKQIDDLAN